MIHLVAIAMVSMMLDKGFVPKPYADLSLEAMQVNRIKTIAHVHSERIDNLKESKKTDVRQKRVQAILGQRDREIERLLNPRQKEHLAEIRKQMKEGVPIGGGFVRSYEFDDYHISRGSGQPRVMSGVDSYLATQEAILRPADGVKFTITNRSGKYARRALFAVSFYDDEGNRRQTEEIEIKNLDNGESHFATVVGPRTRGKVEVKFLEREDK